MIKLDYTIISLFKRNKWTFQKEAYDSIGNNPMDVKENHAIKINFLLYIVLNFEARWYYIIQIKLFYIKFLKIFGYVFKGKFNIFYCLFYSKVPNYTNTKF